MVNYQKRLLKELKDRKLRLTAYDYAALWKRNAYDVKQAATLLKIAGLVTINDKGVILLKEGIGIA